MKENLKTTYIYKCGHSTNNPHIHKYVSGRYAYHICKECNKKTYVLEIIKYCSRCKCKMELKVGQGNKIWCNNCMEERRKHSLKSWVDKHDNCEPVVDNETMKKLEKELLKIKPKFRGECLGNERPCPWISCYWHMISLVNHRTIQSKNDDEIIEFIKNLKETCVLDLCDQGGTTLVEIGDIIGVSRERIRQISDDNRIGKKSAINKLRHVKRSRVLEAFTNNDDIL